MQIPYNYVWFNGVVLNNYHTDCYNRQSKEIEQLENGTPLLLHKIEWLKDVRHNHLCNLFMVYQNSEVTCNE